MPEPKNTNVNLPGAGNWNLPFDRRLTGYGSIGTVDSRGLGQNGREVSVKRGYIKSNTQVFNGERVQTPLKYLYFLYNPATVGTSYSVQLDGPAAPSTVDPTNPALALTQLDQSLNFSLLFDRTYEVLDGSKEGAWRDVRAALALVGVLKNVDQSAMYTTGSDFDSGPMIYTPSYFHFGNQAGGLTYYGFPTSLSIEYTHFSKDMIPIRVGMSISAQLLQLPLADSAGNSESGTTPQDNREGPIYGPFVPPELMPNASPGEQLGSFMNRGNGLPLRLWD